MKSRRIIEIIIVVIGIGLITWYLVLNLSFTTIPEGVPDDYYERIETIEENEATIYVYSDNINFNDDYEYENVNSFLDLTDVESDYKSFLVIDMEKYKDREFATEEEIEVLYSIKKVCIIIVNYSNSGSDQLLNLISDSDYESDLIVFMFDSAYTEKTITNSGEFPTNQMLMYAILHQVSMIIEDIFDSQE